MPEYDDQYALEVARAQRGSGFIAANVSDTGEVLSEAIDPGYLNAPSSDYRAAAALAAAITRRREEEARAEMRARQFKAQQEFNARVAGGERPEMVLRDLATFLVPPEQLSSTIRGTTPAPDQFNARPIIGADGEELGMGVATPSGGMQRIPTARAVAPVLSLEEKAAREVTKKKMDAAYQDLQRAKKDAESDDPERQIAGARRANLRLAEIQGLEQQYTNFQGSASAPVRPQQAAKDLTIDAARQFMRAAGGDKEKARQLALEAGYRL